MVLQRLLLGSARQAILGSSEVAFWGELGYRGKGESLTSGPWRGIALVGVLACLRFPVKS